MPYIHESSRTIKISKARILGIVLLVFLALIISVYCMDSEFQSLDHARMLFAICSLLAIIGASLVGKS